MALTSFCAPRAPGGPGAPDIAQISNGQLPRAKQQFVAQMLEAVLAQAQQ
jgi:hypothetical protein